MLAHPWCSRNMLTKAANMAPHIGMPTQREHPSVVHMPQLQYNSSLLTCPFPLPSMALKVDSTINLKGLLSVRTFLDLSNMVLVLVLLEGVFFLTTVGVVVGTVTMECTRIIVGREVQQKGFVVAKFHVVK
jgi:hypothetical protein